MDLIDPGTGWSVLPYSMSAECDDVHISYHTRSDLNYRLLLPDSDVRSLLADPQLREENIKVLRNFDQV